MQDLIVLITGAAGGLGSALARECAIAGAKLLLLDRNLAGLERLSAKLLAEGLPEPGICSMDLAESGPEEYGHLQHILSDEFGGLDIFIHCAASFEGLWPLDHVEMRHWDSCLRVNLLAAWQIASHCRPLLGQHRRGRVVLIHDDDKVSTTAYWGPYGVSKAALRSLGNIMTEEMEGSGIRVLQFTPKPMRTELRARAFLAEDPQLLTDPPDEAAGIVQCIRKSLA